MVDGGSNVDNLTLEGRTLRRVTGRLIPLLFLMYVVSIIDRTNVSFAALQMNRDLAFSATMYVFGAGSSFWGTRCSRFRATSCLLGSEPGAGSRVSPSRGARSRRR